MGTRSRIGVMHGDIVKSVYCHWDGYLSHNGAILQEHYDSAKANQLVALGDISSLGKNIGEKHAFHPLDLSPEDRKQHELDHGDSTTFYGRDREEVNVSWRVSHTFADFLSLVEDCGAEYYYIMKDGEWYCGSPYKGSRLVALSEALAKDDVTDSEIQADLNETLGLDRGAPLEDLVSRIAELDGV